MRSGAGNKRPGVAALLVAVTTLVASLVSVRAATNCDTLCERVRDELAVFTGWLSEHGVRGYIGEVGWPGDARGDGERWNAVAEAWFRDAEKADLPVTVWATGEWWGDYELAVYRVSEGARFVDTVGRQASVLERFSRSGHLGVGVNVAGAEFGAPDDEPTSPFSNRSPGTHGRDYLYPARPTFEFLAGRGLDLVRIPFRWERLQPRLGQSLDQSELERLKRAVTDAHAAGLRVVLDMHNYGAYYLADGDKGVRRGLGSDQVTKDHFADVWRRLSHRFSEEGVYAYGLMNEPTGMGEAAGLSPARRWEIISQAALEAIRGTGDTTKVMVAGYDWSGVRQWSAHHPEPWITDPAGNFRYEAHHYWDRDGSGKYAASYADEVESSQSG